MQSDDVYRLMSYIHTTYRTPFSALRVMYLAVKTGLVNK